MEMTAPGMGILQRMVYDGETARMSGMAGNKVLEGDELEEMRMEAVLFPELRYDELGYKTELTEMVMSEDGNALYVIKVISPNGKEATKYFNAGNGLLVKEDKTSDTPQGEMVTTTIYSDYREVEDVSIPHTLTQMVGPQKIVMTATEVKVNSGLSDSDFK